MKVVRQARLELSGGSTPDLLSPPPPLEGPSGAQASAPRWRPSGPLFPQHGQPPLCAGPSPSEKALRAPRQGGPAGMAGVPRGHP